jgi:hypothetical protein
MKTVLTAGLLSIALLLAVLTAVQARTPHPPKFESVTPTTLFGE